MSTTEKKEELFPTIGKVADQADQIVVDEEKPTTVAEDDDERVVTEIESLCMKCHEKGTTRLLLTSIPFFREIVVMSFRCEHCGTQNNEIQAAGEIKQEGMAYTTRILDRSDLDRQIVRSPTCEIEIPEFELTLPPTSRGQLTTVEGLIRDIVADLSMDQPLRKIQDPNGYQMIQSLIDKFKEILGDHEDDDEAGEPVGDVKKTAEKDIPMPPFTVKLDDPAGNSFIEFIGSMSDPKWSQRTYHRTLEQNIALGLVNQEELEENKTLDAPKVANPDAISSENAPVGEDEILVFPGICSSCGHPIETNMKKVNIPYFKDILIMSTNCDRCGYRDNEVKSGAAISEKGKRITLKVEDREDLSRDILKSETAGLTIPEIDLVLTHGTLGGRFTTLEGILDQVYDELAEKVFMSGDSSKAEDKVSFETFLENLRQIKNAEHPFTIILDDPLANSYVQNLYAPDSDPNMTIESYERTWEQNEELGLNDIKVEGYEEDAGARSEGKETAVETAS
ncbi:zinc-finger protein zpr1 [Macrolepiota fuliginosa MF-IS2]|uniref:Zinc-finger protein zpr1 n=1 Tax=Macrolepiota fuliginosa MF-IS2 TaxID=1400762 RepID=A0A9P6C036_9AGAR|nr:zinc-finger protein zpr1 [Macrolepiota fuliginosa MF-IS2]